MHIYTRRDAASNWSVTKSLRYPNDPPSTDERFKTGLSGFSKPDKPVINAKDSTGWRNPSPYACPWIGKPYIKGSIEGSGRAGWWEYSRGGDVIYDFDFPSLAMPTPNLLRMKILNNIKDEVFDVAMVLAEMQSTTNMLSQMLYRVGRSLNAVRQRKPESFSYLMHGRRRDGRRPTDKFLRETAGTYLEWKYGITPTLMDIEGASKALDLNAEGSLFDNPPLLVARSRVLQEIPVKLRGSTAYAGGSPHSIEFDLILKREQRARCDFQVTGEGVRGLSRYGIGLGTVGTVLWDKKPFSFVIDMAFPMADLIKAWTALGGVDVKGYTETFHDTLIHKTDASRPLQLDREYISYLRLKPNGTIGTSWFRDTHFRPPYPVPFIRNPIKASNISTVLALFTQLRKP